MSGIEGKVVAITGAKSGIGEATAILLADRGAAVEQRRDAIAMAPAAGATRHEVPGAVTDPHQQCSCATVPFAPDAARAATRCSRKRDSSRRTG
jgi:NADP-dependent 3-hydroxy acid dehydrogenase YdfG